MKKILLTLVLAVILGTNLVYAQGYVPLAPLPCVPGGGVTCATPTSSFTFSNYMQYIFNLSIAIAASAAVFMIVYGGFKYITTASSGGKSEGIDKVKGALYGLLLILTSYIILRTVDPRLVAIRSDLVKPLGIDYSKYKGATDAATNLAAQAAEYLNRSAEGRQKVAGARAKLENDQAQLETLKTAAIEAARKDLRAAGMPDSALPTTIEGACNELGMRNGSAEALMACTAYKNMASSVTVGQANIYIYAQQAIVDKTLSDCIKEDLSDSKVMANCNTIIDNTIRTASNQIVNTYQTTAQGLEDYSTYAKGVLAITEIAKRPGQRTPRDFGLIINASLPYIEKIKQPLDNLANPATKDEAGAKLIAERDKLITERGGQQALIDDGTYLKIFQGKAPTGTTDLNTTIQN